MYHFTKLITLLASLITALELQPPLETPVNPFKVGVSDGGMVFTLTTVPESVATLLANEGFILNKNDIVYPDPKEITKPGLIITIIRATPVILRDGKHEIEILTQARTVDAFLEEQGISLDEKDSLNLHPSGVITPSLRIVITRITEEDTVRRLPVPPPTIFNENPDIPYGRTALKTAGEKGKKEETVRITYRNGDPIKERILSTHILREPKPDVYERGTKIEIGRVLEGRASWYCPQGPAKIKTGLTAASRDFPKGTFLRVTSTENAKSTIVEVTDWVQNPKVIIDLWCTAFKQLAPLKRGVIPVKVEQII